MNEEMELNARNSNRKSNKMGARFTYREYIEFASACEFKKFKDMPLITTDDIRGVAWDSLCNCLQQKPETCESTG